MCCGRSGRCDGIAGTDFSRAAAPAWAESSFYTQYAARTQGVAAP